MVATCIYKLEPYLVAEAQLRTAGPHCSQNLTGGNLTDNTAESSFPTHEMIFLMRLYPKH